MNKARRDFIKNAALTAMASGGAVSTIGCLSRIAAASAPATDYKALVCVFLYGGNDADDCLIPYSQSDYNLYASQRGALAIPRDQLLPLTVKRTDGRSWSFNPNLSEMQGLFNTGKIAILANTGPLVEPVTKARYLADTAKLPRSLFSHQEQQVSWSNSRADDLEAGTGWGGRVADLINSLNAGSKVSMSVSVAGANTFQSANNVFEYQISPYAGSIGLQNVDFGSQPDPVSKAYRTLLANSHPGLFETEYQRVLNRAISTDQIVKSALAGANVSTVFTSGELGVQLQMVARLIASRDLFGLKRQIFFCGVSGFDNHGDELRDHPPLLRELSQGLASFYNATKELGVSNRVTTFTMSDFGRTYRCNGRGADHGWGGHHFILGDAVLGGDIYGKVPTQVIDGPDDTEQGRWIPTTSVEQYAATLASWFGVSSSDLSLALPYLGRFSPGNLGFI